MQDLQSACEYLNEDTVAKIMCKGHTRLGIHKDTFGIIGTGDDMQICSGLKMSEQYYVIFNIEGSVFQDKVTGFMKIMGVSPLTNNCVEYTDESK